MSGAPEFRKRDRRRDLLAFAVMLALLVAGVLGVRQLIGSADLPFVGGDSGTFVDDDGLASEDAHEQLAAAGVTSGCGDPDDRTFCPDEPIARASFAVFLDRVLELSEGDASFADVEPGDLAAGAIARLASAGIVSGCGPDAFCPSESVTRAQAAVFLARTTDLEGDRSTFADVPGDDDVAVAVGLVHAAGWIDACADDRFCPGEPITRGEVAQLLVRSGLVD